MATAALTYLTTDELSARIKYNPRTIRERLLDSVLIEGLHYFRPFGGRKILFIWERIEADMARHSTELLASEGGAHGDVVIPMANGSVCRVRGQVSHRQAVDRRSESGEVKHG